MRVLIFHGYLLGGTGSNVYNAKLAQALTGLGHEVHLLCQDPDAGRFDWVAATGDWDAGRLTVTNLREGHGATVYRPPIGRLLPVYVADTYEGFDARPFPDCSDDEVERYIAANVAAVAEVAGATRPEAALANHLIMGPVILARALSGTGVPYAVKVHGSALEYTVKPHPTRFLPYAREGLAGARTILAGSRHTAESLWAALAPDAVEPRTRLGPPGVDIDQFRPLADPAGALAGLVERLQQESAARDAEGEDGEDAGDSFARDPAMGATALKKFAAGARTAPVAARQGDAPRPGNGQAVAFVGKLIVSKGVDLLLCAWPLVLQGVPDARLVVVGFGAYRDGLERLCGALAAGDFEQVAHIARAGRALEGGPEDSPLRHVEAFFAQLDQDGRAAYSAAAAALSERVLFTGRLDHEDLVDLLPSCEAQVVPSTFPEAFGMVAVEAAACGVFPISANHSGLAEVASELDHELGDPARRWLTFDVGTGAVTGLAACISGWLTAPEDVRSRAREALVRTARERHSWQSVARGVLAAAAGEHAALPPVL